MAAVPTSSFGAFVFTFAGWLAAKVDEHAGASGPPPLIDKQEEPAPTRPVEKPQKEAHHQAEITVPSDDAEIAVPKHEPEIAQPSPTVSSPQTSAKPSQGNAFEEAVPGIDSENTPPKMTFLEKKRMREEDASKSSSEGRTVFYCPGFLITRTYCLHSERAPGPSGVRIQNKVFSDSAGTQLRGWQVLPKEQDTNDDEEGLEAGPSKEWRRGFWNAEKSWEGTGPKPGEVNEVIRRHQSQKTFQPPVVRLPGSELERTLSAAAVRLQTAAAKKRRQNQRLRPAESSSSSSSNSSTSSSSESSAE